MFVLAGAESEGFLSNKPPPPVGFPKALAASGFFSDGSSFFPNKFLAGSVEGFEPKKLPVDGAGYDGFEPKKELVGAASFLSLLPNRLLLGAPKLPGPVFKGKEPLPKPPPMPDSDGIDETGEIAAKVFPCGLGAPPNNPLLSGGGFDPPNRLFCCGLLPPNIDVGFELG